MNGKNKEAKGCIGVPLLKKVFFIVALLGTFGCAATQVALTHKDLDVQTKMSDTIFLDPVSPDKQTVYIQIKNTSDKDLDLSGVIGSLSSKGYKVVNDPEKAYYMLQANVLFVGKADKAAIEQSTLGGFGGALIGMGAGAAISKSYTGMLVGGLIGGAVDMVAGSLVKNVIFSAIVDVQLSERSSAPVQQQTISELKQGGATGVATVTQQSNVVTNWKRYRTRIASIANKVNLKFEEARPAITNGIVRALSGLF